MSLPDQKIPRTKDLIDKDYTQACIAIGDRSVRLKGMQEELDQLYSSVRNLGNEAAARQDMDAKAASKTEPGTLNSAQTDTTEVPDATA